MAAEVIGRDTPLNSLQIALDYDFVVGSCENGYSCVYQRTFSWKTPTTPMPMESNPRAVFERLFGEGGTAAERFARLRQDRSILDLALEDMARLRRRLGVRDRATVDEYLTAVRDVEQRIQRAERQSESRLAAPNAPIGVPETWEEHATVMFDLMALAWEADLTRVFAFMLNREASQLVFPNLGFNEPWHHVSHHGNEPEKLELHVKLNTWQIGVFGKFLERLRSTPDGGGTLLDHSAILWGSGMSDRNTHSPLDVPFLTAGRGAGLVPKTHCRGFGRRR